MAPKIVFVKDLCYWPEEIGLEEKFAPKWVLQNQGDAGEAFFGITYKGKSYIILVDGQRTFHMDANTQGTLTCGEVTIKEFFAEIDEFTEDTTIEIQWLVGYYNASAPEGQQYPVTDIWTTRTYIKVGAGLPVPTWLVAAGLGLGTLLIGGVVLATRRK